ncbi:MAG: NADH:ubiquinone reductase (Na(+)-transporting) subunit F [Bacteroidales bacterium]|nr:NADH:ubiquinone reductase (Na(+)-transporting) subunit F [Bacteroidales bacterium]
MIGYPYNVLAATTSTLTVVGGVTIFLIITLLLVALLLVAKRFLVKSGSVNIHINNETNVSAQAGSSLLSTLAGKDIFLPSACGGKGSCGQCRVRVVEGGGEILPTETVHFSRKEIKEGWRLGCQVKVKEDMAITVPASVLSVKEWECEVISNRNVATFIKEFIVALPEGEHMDFLPGSYAQIKIPKYTMDYDKDIDKALIGEEYLPAWEKFGLFSLKCRNDEDTVRAYSMANYPEEGNLIMLTVRIATPPFKPKPEVGFQDVMPGIASSYIFTLKPGDKVRMSGPYGDFHPILDSKAEMMWIGGGAGMAPLRAQIMYMTKTLHTTDRVMNFFYGARALNEVFYLDDFLQLEKDFPNFRFHLALDRPDPAADAAGVKYTPGFVHQVIYDTYLKNHPDPEDIEYYMCGPGPMSAAVNKMLDSLGVAPESIHYDNFGA